MVEVMILLAVLGTLGLLGAFGVQTYRADPEGFQKLTQRVSRTIRAHVGAGKQAEVKELEKVEDKAIEEWDAEFQGKAVEAANPVAIVHELDETWYEYNAYLNQTKYHWSCVCGHGAASWVQSVATDHSKRHVAEANRAEQAKASGSKLQW